MRTIDLPNDCALVAACACSQLACNGVRCRPLAITYRRRPLHRHIVVVFEFEGRLRGYDQSGAVTLTKTLTFNSRPLQIAKAWVNNPSNEFPYKALKGEWY